MAKATIQSATYWLDGEPLPYRLVRSGRRVKTISLEYKPGRGISLAVPSYMSNGDVARFMQSREQWLRSWKSMIAKAPPPRDWDNGAVIPFRGEDVCVIVDQSGELRRHDGILVQRSIDGGELRVSVPQGMEREQRDRGIAAAIEQWYIGEAKLHLPTRLAQWSELTGLRPERVRVGKARARWGSCSGRRNINLTWRLILLPDRLSDYVIVHELAHLREMNHQRQFWDLVESILPDARERRKELRKRSSMTEG